LNISFKGFTRLGAIRTEGHKNAHPSPDTSRNIDVNLWHNAPCPSVNLLSIRSMLHAHPRFTGAGYMHMHNEKPKILIVEDDEALQSCYELELQDSARILVAFSMQHARKQFAHNNFL
jgi:hypothetical protein